MVTKTIPRQGNLTLSQLTQMLESHVWSFDQQHYQGFIQAQKNETELFRMAVMLGISGVDEYRWAQNRAIRYREQDAVAEERKQISQVFEGRIKYLTEQLEATRQKYMKPVDFFKERLEHHDWYWQYSDDIGVSRRGMQAEREIEQAIKEGGAEFQQAYDEKRAELAARQKKADEENERKRKLRLELETATPKAICQNWYLDLSEATEDQLKNPRGLLIVYGENSEYSTTRISEYERYTNRVKTVSGSIYELGTPHQEFYEKYRSLVNVLKSNC